ncbi:MAG: hypothetical protein HZB23_10545 [Deltaproteobacteria bacterium]|nr:hypothetical protein [Deltaproteobacteria bacterium]
MRARLFVCLFLVPVLALAVSFSLEALLNARLRAPITRMHPEATSAEIQRVSVRNLCAKKIPQLRGICGTYRNIKWIRYAASGFIAAGIFAIWSLLAAQRAEDERRRRISAIMARLRVPALWAYWLGHSALAIGSLHYLAVAFFDRPEPAVIAISLLASLSGAGLMARSVSGAMKEAFRAD